MRILIPGESGRSGSNPGHGGRADRFQGRKLMAAEEHPERHAQPVPAGAPGTRRILIVEDEEVAGRKLQHILQADPQLQVDIVHNGAAALEALSEKNYSLVLTDLRMPGVDGMDL